MVSVEDSPHQPQSQSKPPVELCWEPLDILEQFLLSFQCPCRAFSLWALSGRGLMKGKAVLWWARRWILQGATLPRICSLFSWLLLPKYSNNSSKLPGQTMQLQMRLEILHLPALINFLPWIWIEIMSQLTFSNANEMQKRLVEVVAARFGSCSSAWILTRITHWAHNWLFIT